LRHADPPLLALRAFQEGGDWAWTGGVAGVVIALDDAPLFDVPYQLVRILDRDLAEVETRASRRRLWQDADAVAPWEWWKRGKGKKG